MATLSNSYASKIEVFAEIPPSKWILGLKPAEQKKAWRAAKMAIHELVDLSGYAKLSVWHGGTVPIDIEFLNDVRHFPYVKLEERQSAFPPLFLRLSVTVEYSNRELQKIEWSPPEREVPIEQLQAVYVDSLCDELHSTLLDLYLASSIAHPGRFNIWQCWQFGDEKLIRKGRGALPTFDMAIGLAQKNGWPKITTLGTRTVLDWLTKLPGFSERRGVGRVGRAVAALTHLIRDFSSNDDLNVIWALLGLEAIYCEGTAGLNAQLLNKSEAFLGPREQNKKQVGWMYDFRSRLIHGDRDLFFHHNESYTPPTEKDRDELYESANIATAMLIATLQKLCALNKHSLQFHYRFK